jgi:hypothetical protein
VLVPGGTLAVVWSGPDRDSEFLAQAQAVLNGGDGEGEGEGAVLDARARADLSRAINEPPPRAQALEIPPGVPFDQPEKTEFTSVVPLNAEELVGLLGTFSWVILMEEDARARLLEGARRALDEELGLRGGATVDVGYKAEVWRARRQG